jgi:hypothetical protein
MRGMIRIFNRRLATAALCVTALGAGAAPSALAAPTQVKLHLDGTHPIDADLHQGTFTASPPLCPSGSWLGNGAGSRIFTCADGSGSFTATFQGELEHTRGATGPWTITSGTGSYTALRGKGTATIDSSTGVNSSPIIFSDTWTGMVDFDSTAPTGSVTAVKVVRPRTSRGRWRVTVLFSARDNVDTNPVSFSATATAGPFSASKRGTITSGTGSFTLAFHPTKRTRLLRIAIELSDPWGNTSTIKKSVRLEPTLLQREH